MDKAEFLEAVAAAGRRWGCAVELFHVGQRMYAEAPDVAAGRILDLPLSRLNLLRRSVFKDILAQGAGCENVILNTHATFRWRHGLFYGFDHDLMKALNAELYVVLVDDIDRVHARLLRDRHANHTLKDLMVWREEEILATELLSQIVRGHGCFHILARGRGGDNAEALARLIFARQFRKAYLSFPMTNVTDAGTLGRIQRFRAEMKNHFVCSDPGDLEEQRLARLALAAAEAGERFVTVPGAQCELQIETAELLSIVPDIDGQIYARDFKLIDQSDMIISLIPGAGGPGGQSRPIIASGVERELQHAHEAAKEVFVIWTPQAAPSPFVTETATRVFPSVEEAVSFFLASGYVPAPSPGRLFD
ncbi:MAG: hypothetical protein AMJ81_00575 [Phycisphaerae bacterium SM23_33]|nr:MAG: hypothetical protein AMJ81_00575 [Phycisphaerae bacterium SM23_33]